jgi:serine/threonine-protein kinase
MEPVPFGAFELLELAARGGMGAVWRARHRATGRTVAVKLLDEGLSDDPQFRDAFRWEVRATARLDHPAIVRVHDVGEAPETGQPGIETGAPFLAMEWLPGGSLKPHCGQLPWPSVRQLLLATLDALGHAHGRGIIHRDLKPANLLFTADGQHAKLTDFGVAHPVEPHDADGGQIAGLAGTPAYMAPEQTRPGILGFGPWTDLYGFGCLAWRLSFGEPLFEGGVMSVLRAQFEAPAPAVPDAAFGPPGYERWLHRLLEKAPEARFQTAAAAAWALRQLEPAHPVTATNEPAERATIRVRPAAWSAAGRPRRPSPPPVPERTGPPLPATWRGRDIEHSAERVIRGRDSLDLFGVREVRFVGRETERDTMWQSLTESVERGAVRAVSVSGPQGCGKTRLATWMAARAVEVGAARVIHVTYQAMMTPDDGVRAAIVNALGYRDLDHEARRERLHGLAKVGDWSDVLRRAVETVVCGGPHTSARPARRPAVALATALRAVATLSPIVLVLDDAHWASEELELVEALLSGPDAPILTVLTWEIELSRQSTHSSGLLRLSALSAVTAIELGALPRETFSTFVRGALPLAPATADQVFDVARGLPGRAVGLLASWLAGDALEASPEGLVLVDDDDAPTSQTSPALLWSRHLDRAVGPKDMGALTVGAVLGEFFSPEVWLSACARAGVPASHALLDRWAAAGIVQLERAPRRVRLMDRIVRSVLLARLADDLAPLHQACAAALAGEDAADQLARRGQHLLSAGDPVEGAAVLLEAARRQYRAGRLEHARQLVIARVRSLHHAGVGRRAEAWQEGRLLLCAIVGQQGRVAAARRLADRTLDVVETEGFEILRPRALYESGHALRLAGEFPTAAERLRKAFQAAEEMRDGELVCEAGESLLLTLRALSRLDTASRLVRHLLDLPEDYVDPANRANLHYIAGLIEWSRPDPQSAQRCADTAHEQLRALRDDWGLARNRLVLADLARDRGDLEVAVALNEQSIEDFAALGTSDGMFPLSSLASLAREAGRLDEAVEHIDAATALANRAGRTAVAAMCACIAATIYAARSEWDAATRALREGGEVLNRVGLATRDVAEELEACAEIAAHAKAWMVSDLAVRLAADQWRALGNAERAAAADARGRSTRVL